MLSSDRSREQLVDCVIEGGAYSAQDALSCYLRSVSDEGYELPQNEVMELTDSIDSLPNGEKLTDTEKAVRRMSSLLCLANLAVSASGLIEREREELFKTAVISFGEQFKANPVQPSELSLSDVTSHWDEMAKITGNEWLARALESSQDLMDESKANEPAGSSTRVNLASTNNVPMLERSRKPARKIPREIAGGIVLAGIFLFWSIVSKDKHAK